MLLTSSWNRARDFIYIHSALSDSSHQLHAFLPGFLRPCILFLAYSSLIADTGLPTVIKCMLLSYGYTERAWEVWSHQGVSPLALWSWANLNLNMHGCVFAGTEMENRGDRFPNDLPWWDTKVSPLFNTWRQKNVLKIHNLSVTRRAIHPWFFCLERQPAGFVHLDEPHFWPSG